ALKPQVMAHLDVWQLQSRSSAHALINPTGLHSQKVCNFAHCQQTFIIHWETAQATERHVETETKQLKDENRVGKLGVYLTTFKSTARGQGGIAYPILALYCFIALIFCNKETELRRVFVFFLVLVIIPEDRVDPTTQLIQLFPQIIIFLNQFT